MTWEQIRRMIADHAFTSWYVAIVVTAILVLQVVEMFT